MPCDALRQMLTLQNVTDVVLSAAFFYYDHLT